MHAALRRNALLIVAAFISFGLILAIFSNVNSKQAKQDNTIDSLNKIVNTLANQTNQSRDDVDVLRKQLTDKGITPAVEKPTKIVVQGSPGSQGVQGLTGLRGTVGLTGTAGVAGPKGVAGVPGPAGVQGPSGPQGDKGVPGDKGEKGDPGIKGDTGMKGTTGDTGPPGPSPKSGYCTPPIVATDPWPCTFDPPTP